MQCALCGTHVPEGFTVCTGCGAEYSKRSALAGLVVFVSIIAYAAGLGITGFSPFSLVNPFALAGFGLAWFIVKITKPRWWRPRAARR